MKNKILLCLLTSLCFTASASFAQVDYILLQDAKGNIITDNKYSNVEGTPFVYGNWVTGSLALDNEKVYNNVLFKYDQADDKIYIKGEKDEMLFLNANVKDFTINPAGENTAKHFQSGFKVPGTAPTSYFEILADGKTQFLKRTVKVIQENKDYNSASGTKVFYETNKLYLYRNGKATQVKKDKKSILEALGDKQAELEAYAKTNNINFKNEGDIAKLITYYNTI